MNKIMGLDYIEDIGIKEKVCYTLLENTIYILNNGKKYKSFGEDYKDLSQSANLELKDTLVKQTEYANHSLISFPELVICDKKSLYGIVSPFEKGIPLSNIDPLTEIDCLIYLIEYLEKGIEDISFAGWDLEDLHENNILINLETPNRCARVIDTDFYYHYAKKDKLEIYKANLRRISSAILNSVLPNLKVYNIPNNELIQDYTLVINGLMKPSTFLKKLLLQIRSNYETPKDIKTLRKTI